MALHLAKKGFSVVVHYRSSVAEAESTLEEVQHMSPNSMLVQGDVTQSTDVADIFQAIAKRYGALDVLVNNVGNLGDYHTLPDVSIEEFDDVMNSNVRSMFLCMRRALPLLRRAEQGRVITMTCAGAQNNVARVYTAPYYAAKSAVLTLTKSWAKELQDTPITVNAIAPGIVENSVVQPNDHVPITSYADIMGTLDYYLSPEADKVTGEQIEVTNGWKP